MHDIKPTDQGIPKGIAEGIRDDLDTPTDAQAPVPDKPLTTEEWIAKSLLDMQELARNPELLARRKFRSF